MPQISRTSGNVCRQRIVGSPLLKHPVAGRSIGTALLLLLLSFRPGNAATLIYTDGENNSNPINVAGDSNFFLSISSGSAIQSGPITGNGFIKKIGDGTLSLTAANTPSNLAADGGILKIAGGGTVSTGIATVSYASGAVGTLNIDGAGSLLSVTNFLRVAQSGSGTLTITNGGAVTANSSVLGQSGNAATVTVDGPGSSLSSKSLSLNSAGSSLTISNGGSVSGDNAYMSRGTASISGGSWTNSASLVVGYDGTGTLTQTGGQITAPVVSVGLNDNGAGPFSDGTLNLNGGIVTAGQVARGVVASGTTVTSTLNFDGGTVRLTGAQGALFNGITNVTLNLTGATIDTQGFAVATASNLVGTGGLTKAGSGTLTLTGTNTYSGGTTISAGALQGTTTSLQGNITGSGSLAFNQTATGTYAGVFSGTGSLSKSGSGTVTLSAAQAYTGSTLIAGGTLEVNNSLASSAVTVFSGGTLTGTGTLAGAVTVENGGALSPGGSPGTLTMASLELKNNAILNFELGMPGVVGGGVNDLVAVGADLTLDGVLNLTKSTNFGAGTYTIFTYGGSLIDHSLSMGIVPGGYNYTINTGTSGQVKLTVDTTGLQFWNGAVTTADGTVHGGDGTWATGTTNWTNADGVGSSAWGGGTAVFSGISGTVTVSGTQSVQRMEFINDEYIITGGALDIGAGAELMADDFGTIASTITGTGGVTIAGAGTIALTGSNTYLGGTTLESGRLQIGSDAALGAAAGGLTIQHGVLFTTATMSTARDIVFDNPDGTILVDDATTLTLSGSLSGYGGMLKTGNGTLKIAGTGNINHNVTVQGGKLKITGTLTNVVGAIGDADDLDGMVVVDGPGAVWNVTNLNVIGNTGSGSLEIFNGGHVQNYYGYIGLVADSFGGALVSGADSKWDTTAFLIVGDAGEGELTIEDGGAVSDSTGVLGNSAGGAGSVRMEDGTWSNIDDLKVGYRGGGDLTQNGGEISAPIVHVAEISGSTGALNLNGGKLTTGKVEAGQGTATVSFDGGKLVATGDETDFLGNFTEAGQVVLESGGGTIDNNGHAIGIQSPIVGNGTLTFTGSGVTTLRGANTYAGWTTISGGTLTGDTTSLRGNIVNNASLIFDQAGDGSYPGAIMGPGSLTKTGSGTVTLSSDSPFTGDTTISDGTLIVTDHGALSSSLGSGAVNVGASGTLGGVGFVLGNTMVLGTLAPGAPVGSLSFASNLSLTDTSTMQMALASLSSFDQIGVTGQLTYDGLLTITLLGGYRPGVGDSFQLFSAGTVTPLSGFDAISFDLPGYAGTFDTITGTLSITSIPEPSVGAMMGLALGIIVLFRRKAGGQKLASRSGARAVINL